MSFKCQYKHTVYDGIIECKSQIPEGFSFCKNHTCCIESCNKRVQIDSYCFECFDIQHSTKYKTY